MIPLVLSLRNHHLKIEQEVLAKWEHRVSPEDFERLRRFADELIAKILHTPSAELKHLGAAGLGLESRLILEKLFDLQEDEKG